MIDRLVLEDKAYRNYVEGVYLTSLCKTQQKHAQLQIEGLERKSDGGILLRPHTSESGARRKERRGGSSRQGSASFGGVGRRAATVAGSTEGYLLRKGRAGSCCTTYDDFSYLSSEVLLKI